MSDGYTPTTEEIREYIAAADRATAHMVSLDAPDAVEAFDRWLAARDAKVIAAALKEAAKEVPQFLPGRDNVDAWLWRRAYRIENSQS